MMMAPWWEDLLGGALGSNAAEKVAVFVLVQALVYLILSKSSGVFSATARQGSFGAFRTMRSVSIRRILAALSDTPGEAASDPQGPSRSVSRRMSASSEDSPEADRS